MLENSLATVKINASLGFLSRLEAVPDATVRDASEKQVHEKKNVHSLQLIIRGTQQIGRLGLWDVSSAVCLQSCLQSFL